MSPFFTLYVLAFAVVFFAVVAVFADVAAVEATASYEEYRAQGGAPATGEGLNYVAKIEGEDSTRRSESSLYAKFDKASANKLSVIRHTACESIFLGNRSINFIHPMSFLKAPSDKIMHSPFLSATQR